MAKKKRKQTQKVDPRRAQAARFKYLRKRIFGWTQVRMAEKLGYAPITISCWETGVAPVPKVVLDYLEFLARVARAQRQVRASKSIDAQKARSIVDQITQ